MNDEAETDHEHAFPSPFESKGMDLRDYFAAKAMQGMEASGEWIENEPREIAHFAYDMADAMIEAKGKRSESNCTWVVHYNETTKEYRVYPDCKNGDGWEPTTHPLNYSSCPHCERNVFFTGGSR